MKGKCILPIIFTLVFALSRFPGLMPANFSVAYAFAFCAGVFFRGRLGLWLPLAVIIATDVGLNLYYQFSSPRDNVWSPGNLANLGFNYLAYSALFFLGRQFKPSSSLVSLISGGILGAILFYFITNTASWFFNPFHNQEYTRNLSGWIIALTTGVDGYPSTWEFFGKTLLSSGLFAALFGALGKITAESPADKAAGSQTPADSEAANPEIEPAPTEGQA